MNNNVDIVKKSLLTASLVGLVVAFSNNANASPSERVRFYVGAGVGASKHSLKGDFKNKIEVNNKGSIKKSSGNLLMPILGIKFPENFGAEFGYEFHTKLKISGTNEGNLRSSNIFADIIGYMPIDNNKIDLIGGLGLGRMFMKENGSVGAMGDGNSYAKFGLRAKFGGQIKFNNNCGARGLVTYQTVGGRGGKQAINSTITIGADVIYFI